MSSTVRLCHSLVNCMHCELLLLPLIVSQNDSHSSSLELARPTSPPAILSMAHWHAKPLSYRVGPGLALFTLMGGNWQLGIEEAGSPSPRASPWPPSFSSPWRTLPDTDHGHPPPPLPPLQIRARGGERGGGRQAQHGRGRDLVGAGGERVLEFFLYLRSVYCLSMERSASRT